MFYSQFILAKKGPLGTIWIAAHLERKLRKNQVADTDIGVSVDSILFPEMPIALRLSSHLLLGVVRIYSRKVNYLFDDCSEALLKVKQAFRSTAVDLPPEESTAPYHSITLPETFDLDDFELPDNENLQGSYVDHHISSKDQITLQDTMDGVVYSTSKFGLDERFGDGDASGLDLDEEMLVEKAATPEHIIGSSNSNFDPQASVQANPSLKYGDDRNAPIVPQPMPARGIVNQQMGEVDGGNEVVEYAQAPCTPGLWEEPNLSNIQETSACDDNHHETENHTITQLAVKENLENKEENQNQILMNDLGSAPLTQSDLADQTPPIAVIPVVQSEDLSKQNSRNEESQMQSVNENPVDFREFELNTEPKDSGNIPSLRPCTTLPNHSEVADSPPPPGFANFPSLKTSGDSLLVQGEGAHANEALEKHMMDINLNEAGMNEEFQVASDVTNRQVEFVTQGEVQNINRGSSDFPAPEKPLSFPQGLLDVPRNFVPENANSTPVEQDVPRNFVPPNAYFTPAEQDVSRNFVPVNATFTPVEQDVPRNFVPENAYFTPAGEQDVPRNFVPQNAYFTPAAEQDVPRNFVSENAHFTPAVKEVPRNFVPENATAEKEVPRNFVPTNATFTPAETELPRNFAPQNAYFTPAAEKEVPRNFVPENATFTPAEPRNFVPTNAYFTPAENEISRNFVPANVTFTPAEKELPRNFVPQNAYFTPAEQELPRNFVPGNATAEKEVPRNFVPTTVTFTPAEREVPRNFVPTTVTFTPAEKDVAIGSYEFTGKKRSFTESSMTAQSLNLNESSGFFTRNVTTESAVNDDDLLSSILVGRKSSSILKMKPTPPVQAPTTKRRKTTPKTGVTKRKVLMDDNMVLHGDVIRQQLINTEDIRRLRKKAPCTRSEISMLEKQFWEDELFYEAIFTGVSVKLTSLQSQMYDLSKIVVTRPEGESDPKSVPWNDEPETQNTGDLSKTVVTHHEGGTDPKSIPWNDEPEAQNTGDLSKIVVTHHEGGTDPKSIPWNDENTGFSVDLNGPKENGGEDNFGPVAIKEVSEAPPPGFPFVFNDQTCVNNNTTNLGDVAFTSEHEVLGKETAMEIDGKSFPDSDPVDDESLRHADVVVHDDTSADASLEKEPPPPPPGFNIVEKTDLQSVDMDISSIENSVASEIKDPAASVREISQEAEHQLVTNASVAHDALDAAECNGNIHGEDLGTVTIPDAEINPILESVPLEERENSPEMDDDDDDDDIAFDNPIDDDDDDDDDAYSPVGNDTEFLNLDDVDDDEIEAEAGDMPGGDTTRVIDNTGWSSRTKAVAKYLQIMFDKEGEKGRNLLPLNNLLNGKTRKEAARMFFETLVLKTKDYIHVEQRDPFDNVNIFPRAKLLKSDF